MSSQIQTQRMPGLQCPRCNSFIPTSIHELLSSNHLKCPICGLQLDIDRQKSDKALKALAKVELAQRQVDEKSSFKR